MALLDLFQFDFKYLFAIFPLATYKDAFADRSLVILYGHNVPTVGALYLSNVSPNFLIKKAPILLQVLSIL